MEACASRGFKVDATKPIAEMKDTVRKFCEARDWDEFHGAKDLAIGVVTEASELLEIFRFKSDPEISAMLEDRMSRLEISHELADSLFFILRFAQRFDFDLATALEEKMKLNEQKYPVSRAKGSNRKYSEY
jgi:NTP pyrophosphatase (non-canonical NTP hydrolase)